MALPSRKQEPEKIEYRREVIGLFQSPEALESAIGELGSAGWDRAEMSLLGENMAVVHHGSEKTADDPETGRKAVMTETDQQQGRTLTASMAGVIAAFVASGATIMTGGTAVAAIVGAAAAGGGATVAVEAIARFLDNARDDTLKQQLAGGGILLWVLLRQDKDEGKARAIMMRCGATSVHAHEIPPPRE